MLVAQGSPQRDIGPRRCAGVAMSSSRPPQRAAVDLDAIQVLESYIVATSSRICHNNHLMDIRQPCVRLWCEQLAKAMAERRIPDLDLLVTVFAGKLEFAKPLHPSGNCRQQLLIPEAVGMQENGISGKLVKQIQQLSDAVFLRWQLA